MEVLKYKITSEAIKLGICKEGLAKLQRSDRDGIVDYYIDNPDWCMERDWPKFQTLESHFSDLDYKGIYVGKTFKKELLDNRLVYILHNCRGSIRVRLNVEEAILPMFYLCNNCRIRFIGEGEEFPDDPPVVPIYSFGHNDISARANRYIKYHIFKHNILDL